MSRPANAAKKVEDAKGYTAMYGTFREGDEAFDEGVALFFRCLLYTSRCV